MGRNMYMYTWNQEKYPHKGRLEIQIGYSNPKLHTTYIKILLTTWIFKNGSAQLPAFWSGIGMARKKVWVGDGWVVWEGGGF